MGVTPFQRVKFVSYCAYQRVSGKPKYIGCFKIEELAALVRDRFLVNNNISSPLNFPNLSVEQRNQKINELIIKNYQM